MDDPLLRNHSFGVQNLSFLLKYFWQYRHFFLFVFTDPIANFKRVTSFKVEILYIL